MRYILKTESYDRRGARGKLYCIIAGSAVFLRQLNIAITQQEPPINPLSNSENLGLALVICGILTVALAAWRYNQVFWQIERADYRPNRLMVWIMTGVVIILGLLSIPLLLQHFPKL